ncbi:MAG: hypothetical protein FWH11_12425 [Micrococcales bacterium]|nr:hypothetical protein [Micrococcales bacterium]
MDPSFHSREDIVAAAQLEEAVDTDQVTFEELMSIEIGFLRLILEDAEVPLSPEATAKGQTLLDVAEAYHTGRATTSELADAHVAAWKAYDEANKPCRHPEAGPARRQPRRWCPSCQGHRGVRPQEAGFFRSLVITLYEKPDPWPEPEDQDGPFFHMYYGLSDLGEGYCLRYTQYFIDRIHSNRGGAQTEASAGGPD